jgi:hypothetical protein
MKGDAGAHGVFSDRAKNVSPQLWANTHRGFFGATLAVLATVGLVKLLRRE